MQIPILEPESSGTLAEQPLIDAALRLLALNTEPQLAFSEISALLRSPFLAGGNSEASLRARLEVQLRHYKVRSLTFADWQALCPSDSILAQCLRKQTTIRFMLERPYSEWVSVMRTHLEYWGWPGERTLSLTETEALACWKKLCDITSQESMSFSSALHSLRQRAQMTVFSKQNTAPLPAPSIKANAASLSPGPHAILEHGLTPPPPCSTQQLQSQWDCPFQSFARYRLYARPLPEPALSITPAERGILLHKTLEIFWNRLQTQAALIALSPKACLKHIQSALQKACSLNTSLKVPKRILDAEQYCLVRLIARWMEYEKKRPAFTVIATEVPCQMTLAGLPVVIRIDRVDQLSDGKLWLIDYKTGKGHYRVEDWLPTQLKDLQMPLYALAYHSKQAIAGIAIAQIHAERMRWIELACENSTDIPVLTETWQASLHKVASDILEGIVSVTPRDGKKTCQYCNLEALCRVNE